MILTPEEVEQLAKNSGLRKELSSEKYTYYFPETEILIRAVEKLILEKLNLTLSPDCNTVKHETFHPYNQIPQGAPPPSPTIVSHEVQKRL